ncbi:hypothetical protein GCM10017744_025120 [Streptomyces antimycoticus]
MVGVEAGAQQVVDPGDDGGQVGAVGQGGGELLGVDLRGEAAPYGEVGVGEAGVVVGEVFGEAVGEAAQTGGLVAVAQALGLAVAQRDVATVGRVSAGHGCAPSVAGP